MATEAKIMTAQEAVDAGESTTETTARLVALAEKVRSRIPPVGGVLGISGLRIDLDEMKAAIFLIEERTGLR